jgi:superfamily I DNA and/or RNA helicase
MNVGLTRAKCSLFVLGHARSLSNSEYWGDLVRDAQKRSLITDVSPYKSIHLTLRTNHPFS